MPLVTKELSLRHIGLAAEAFQILKDARGRNLSVSSIWEDLKRHEEELLKGHSEDELRLALLDLVSLGMARPWGTDRYQITDPGQETTKADVVYGMLERPYKENKAAVESYLGKRRNERRIVLFGILFLFVLFLLLIWLLRYPFAAPIVPIVAIGLVAAFFALVGLNVYSNTRTWRKYQLSVERALAVRLLDAYRDYRPFIAGEQTSAPTHVEKTVMKVALSLEGLRQDAQTTELTDWDTIHCESERAFEVGQKLTTTVIPSIKKKQYSERIGEILVRLARLLLEGSPDSMKQATELFKDPRFKDLPAGELAVSVPLREAVLQRVTHPIFARFLLFAVLIAIGYVILVTVKGWQILGAPTDYFGLLAALSGAYMVAHVSQSGRAKGTS